jgi:hypothetical protein
VTPLGSPPASASHKTNVGAIGGGIGAGVGTLVVGSIIASFFLRRRRHLKAKKLQQELDVPFVGISGPNSPHSRQIPSVQCHELAHPVTLTPAELHGSHAVPGESLLGGKDLIELGDNTSTPRELPGDKPIMKQGF